MKTYGQFCPFALAAEIIGERWTPLVLRELILGRTRFNDIHRGLPRMSPTLLVRRLATLEGAGLVARRRVGSRSEYVLTEAGRELAPAVAMLAEWGKRWLPATLSRAQADPDPVMWDMHRRMNLDALPAGRTVVRFSFGDQPKTKRHRWIVAEPPEIDLCITDPGFEVDVFVETDSRTIAWVWYGDIPLRDAIAKGLIDLHGPRELCRAFPSWLLLNELAPIPRRNPLRAA
ncbi:MAG TPA: helix-turn-helix domain-containing protein [Bauldia sp.]|nr:helix-turn-helix domain-containing protein [Bauldia sp.]